MAHATYTAHIGGRHKGSGSPPGLHVGSRRWMEKNEIRAQVEAACVSIVAQGTRKIAHVPGQGAGRTKADSSS